MPKYVYTIGYVLEKFLAPFNMYLVDCPHARPDDPTHLGGSIPLHLACRVHGPLPAPLTGFELRKLVELSRRDGVRSACFRCAPPRNALSGLKIKEYVENKKRFDTHACLMQLVDSAEAVDRKIQELYARGRSLSESLEIRVRAIPPTDEGARTNQWALERTVRWRDLVKGKQVFALGKGRPSRANFLFFVLLQVSDIDLVSEVQVDGLKSATGGGIFLDFQVKGTPIYYELNGGPHFRAVYSGPGRSAQDRLMAQRKRDRWVEDYFAKHPELELRKILTYDEEAQQELPTRDLMQRFRQERDRLLRRLGREVRPLDPRKLAPLMGRWHELRGWPDRVADTSGGFYRYVGYDPDGDLDRALLECEDGHQIVLILNRLSLIFHSLQARAYSHHGCIGCQNNEKLDRFGELLDRWAEGHQGPLRWRFADEAEIKQYTRREAPGRKRFCRSTPIAVVIEAGTRTIPATVRLEQLQKDPESLERKISAKNKRKKIGRTGRRVPRGAQTLPADVRCLLRKDRSSGRTGRIRRFHVAAKLYNDSARRGSPVKETPLSPRRLYTSWASLLAAYGYWTTTVEPAFRTLTTRAEYECAASFADYYGYNGFLRVRHRVCGQTSYVAVRRIVEYAAGDGQESLCAHRDCWEGAHPLFRERITPDRTGTVPVNKRTVQQIDGEVRVLSGGWLGVVPDTYTDTRRPYWIEVLTGPEAGTRILVSSHDNWVRRDYFQECATAAGRSLHPQANRYKAKPWDRAESVLRAKHGGAMKGGRGQ